MEEAQQLYPQLGLLANLGLVGSGKFIKAVHSAVGHSAGMGAVLQVRPVLSMSGARRTGVKFAVCLVCGLHWQVVCNAVGCTALQAWHGPNSLAQISELRTVLAECVSGLRNDINTAAHTPPAIILPLMKVVT